MAEDSKLAEKLEEKDSQVKFTDDELSKVAGIRDRYLEIQHQFGQTAIMKLRLEDRVVELNTTVDSLKEEYKKNQDTERDFLAEINKKYGEGQLDPETGVFTPNK